MSRFHVDIVAPNALVSGDGDPREAFERIWREIPKERPRRLWWFLPERGLFVKGRLAAPELSLRRLVRSRRLAAEVETLERFAARGAPVPRVFAHGHEQRRGFHVRSWVVLEHFGQVVDLEHYLALGTDLDRPARRRRVFEAVGDVTRRLHASGCFHRDLSDRNILLRLDGDAVAVWLVDCPRGVVDPTPLRGAWLRRLDLFRLARSCLRHGATDEEVAGLLERAGLPRPSPALAAAHRSLDTARARPLRARLWLATGH